MAACKENTEKTSHLNDEFFDIMKDGGTFAPYLFCPLSKIPYFEHTSQIKLLKDPHSVRVNDLLKN